MAQRPAFAAMQQQLAIIRSNVGGSFRVAKGVDVTAGVRYSRDSDRVDPAAAKADNEAVYVGTKIKF